MNGLWQRWRRSLAVAQADARQIIRDRFTLSLLVTVPAVQLVLFGLTVNLNPKELPVAIAGSDTKLVRALVDRSDYFRVIGGELGPGEAIEFVRAKRALIAIETTRTSDQRVAVQISADATDPAAVRPALLSLQIALWKSLSSANVPLTVDWLYNENGSGTWAIVPGLVGVIVMITTLLLGALSLVRERERGTWESLMSVPATPLDIVIGKLLPILIFALLQTCIVVLLANVLFAVPIRGSLAALLLAAVVFASAHVLIGFIVSGCVTSQLQAIQTAVMFYLPCMLLSGFMFPFQGMPRWAQIIGEALPLTHFVRVARNVLLRGEGLTSTAVEMIPVLGLIALMLPIVHRCYALRLQSA